MSIPCETKNWRLAFDAALKFVSRKWANEIPTEIKVLKYPDGTWDYIYDSGPNEVWDF